MELADGWIAPFNGYHYKATSTEQSWEEGRRICRDWGADLAVYGYRDFTVKAGSHRSRQRQRYRSVAVTSNVKVFTQKILAVTEVIFLISSVLR